jgi:hypothetical protein
VYFLPLGAAALVIGLAVWARERIPALRVSAILLGIDALTFVVAEAFESTPSTPTLITIWLVLLVTSLATVGTFAAFASVERKPLVIAGAACWTLGSILGAMTYLWAIAGKLGSELEMPASFDLAPYVATAVGGLCVAIAARAKQPRAIALVAMLAGSLLVWCLGEEWLMNIGMNDDAARTAALRQFRNVGYVGWHVVLAAVLWRSAASNLPPARVVTNRTASP